MKKAVKAVGQFIGMLSVMGGLIVCMCEADNMEKQVMIAGVGLGFIAFGALVSILANRGEQEDDVLSR